MLLLSAYKRIRKNLMLFGSSEESFRMTILITAIIHNYTEASFNKLGPLWFVTCFAVMEYRTRQAPKYS